MSDCLSSSFELAMLIYCFAKVNSTAKNETNQTTSRANVAPPICDGTETEENHCETLLMCIITTLNEGLRNGGGIGDILRKPSQSVRCTARFKTESYQSFPKHLRLCGSDLHDSSREVFLRYSQIGSRMRSSRFIRLLVKH